MSTPPVKSAHRVLELLEFFADEQRAATVKEISSALGYPQSSTSVLLKSLSEAGYFDHDPRTGLYSPNVRLALATAWIEEHLFSEQSLMRLMHQVHDACGHTVMVGKLQGAQVRYLHVLQATRPGRFTAKIGSLRPLFLSAPGRMLLSTRPERELPSLLRRANALETDVSRHTTPEAAQREWQAARQQGWAISQGTSIAGAAGLAILLPVPRHHDAMTLSLGGPVDEIVGDRPRLVQLLHDSVASLRQVVTR
jgi:DNA-binding IclR family transcriptional regulator